LNVGHFGGLKAEYV